MIASTLGALRWVGITVWLMAVGSNAAASSGAVPADPAAPVPAVASSPAEGFQAGLSALDRGQILLAIQFWTAAAQAGHAAAAYNLGVLYEQGWAAGGKAPDLKQAGHWYLQAAQTGDLDAQLAVARLYESGQGLPRSVASARFWLNRLAASPVVDPSVGPLVQKARDRLRSLPPDEQQEFRFEGGRFLFREALLPRCVIALQGRITRDASREFHRVVDRARTLGCTEPWIVLESPGGSLPDGIELGRAIRLEGYSTVVARSCASSCALIFMGGRERHLIGPRARIGLHQSSSSNAEDPNARKTCYSSSQDSASKSKRRYLREVLADSGEAVFERAMKTSCHSIDWIRSSEALELQIATRVD